MRTLAPSLCQSSERRLIFVSCPPSPAFPAFQIDQCLRCWFIQHIYIQMRGARMQPDIYITTRTPGKANYQNVLKSVENDLCFNFNLNPNLLFNLISFSDWRFTFYIMHTYWIVLILIVFVIVILPQSLKPANYKETLGWHVHGISNFDIANGGRKSKIVLFLPGRWQREIYKKEHTFGFPATEWILK